VQLRYGGGALQTNQLDKFLKVQSGTVTLSGPGVSINDSWGVGYTGANAYSAGWGPYVRQQPTVNGVTKNGWATFRYTNFGTLPPGTYTMNIDLEVASAVNDGFGSTGPGPWVKVDNYTFTVH
jgi:hypothetical protein